MRGRKEELGAETSERGGSGGPGCAGRDWRLCIAIGLPSDSESRRLMNSASPSTSWSELSRGKPWPWPHHRRQALTAHACDRSTRGTEHKTRSSRPSLPRFSWFWDQSEVYETAPQKNNQKQTKEPLIVLTLKKWGCFLKMWRIGLHTCLWFLVLRNKLSRNRL